MVLQGRNPFQQIFFYKHLGSATLSWFRYFTLLVCCEHLSWNLLNSYCATPWVFSFSGFAVILEHISLYLRCNSEMPMKLCPQLLTTVSGVFDVCAWERLPVSSGKIWSAIIDLVSPENPDSWVMAKYPVPGYCGETAEILWWRIWLRSQGEDNDPCGWLRETTTGRLKKK